MHVAVRAGCAVHLSNQPGLGNNATAESALAVWPLASTANFMSGEISPIVNRPGCAA